MHRIRIDVHIIFKTKDDSCKSNYYDFEDETANY